MNMMYFSILGAVAFLAGCKETSFALCTLINEQELCIKEQMLKEHNSRPVDIGQRVRGDSGSYYLIPSRDNWIQLDSGRNKKYPNRDLRLVHPTGGSVDVSILPVTEISAFDLAATEITSVAASLSGKTEILSTDNWSKTFNDAAYLRFCYPIEDSGSGCLFSVVLKEENQSLKLTGITADHAEWVNKMESMLLSTTPILEGKK